MKNKTKKIIIAMSGGVDSSVAGKLLSGKGYEAMGIFLHFWQEERAKDKDFFKQVENKCCSAKALMDARRVCQKIGIPLYTYNFSRQFKKEIVDDFLNEYKQGRTPNPCVRCNKFVKLGLLIKKAQELGYDYVASGHYVRVRETRKRENKKIKIVYKLFKAEDKDKDQSYFLYTLTQEQLKHLIFPLGGYVKDDVRKLAKKYKLGVAEKKESQEICFIPEKSHNDFLRRYLKLKPGPIKVLLPLIKGETERGFKEVGEHQGLPLYTIGQRRGVEIGGIGPFYVLKCDYKANTLYVTSDRDDPLLYSDSLVAKNVNWISGTEPKIPLNCEAVIRYRHKPVKCKVESHKGKNNYKVKFSKPQRAVTAGQSIVFYRKNEVLGGGIIS